MILKQEQAIITNNRNLIAQAETPKAALAMSRAGDGNGAGTTIHDHSDRYELSVSNEIID